MSLQENAVSSRGGGSRVVGRKGGVGSRTYCTDAARGLYFGLFEMREERDGELVSSLSPCRDTLDKCKERIVETSRIVDPRSKPVRATLLSHCPSPPSTRTSETVPLSREMILIS